jgi:hypothetical protein
MKYIATLNLWDSQIKQAIERGQIKLQRGQWLRCGTEGKRCRFVGVLNNESVVSGSKKIWVTHWQGTAKATAEKFAGDQWLMNQYN